MLLFALTRGTVVCVCSIVTLCVCDLKTAMNELFTSVVLLITGKTKSCSSIGVVKREDTKKEEVSFNKNNK